MRRVIPPNCCITALSFNAYVLKMLPTAGCNASRCSCQGSRKLQSSPRGSEPARRMQSSKRWELMMFASRSCHFCLLVSAVLDMCSISVRFRFSVVQTLPSVLLYCWLGIRKSIQTVKNEWWAVDEVICLERAADCMHMVLLMPLSSPNPIISCLV